MMFLSEILVVDDRVQIIKNPSNGGDYWLMPVGSLGSVTSFNSTHVNVKFDANNFRVGFAACVLRDHIMLCQNQTKVSTDWLGYPLEPEVAA